MSSSIEETVLVYIVDDDDAVRDSLSLLLELEGFETAAFSSAEEFLAMLGVSSDTVSRAACLLLDLHMPNMSGHEVLDGLAEGSWKFPIIVMTGNPDPTTKSRVFSMGAVAYLEKPVDADQLIHTLRFIRK